MHYPNIAQQMILHSNHYSRLPLLFQATIVSICENSVKELVKH